MQIHNTPDRWGAVQQTLHWLIVALAVVQIGAGFYMGGFPPDEIGRLSAFSLHATLGLTILVLMLARLAWRMSNPVPLMPERLGPPERALVRLTHYGFYVLLIVLPITGYLMASARGYPITFYGLNVPRLVGPDETLATAFFYGHFVGVALTVLSLALHVAGALRHEFILRDNTLRRMTSLPPREGDYAARTTRLPSASERVGGRALETDARGVRRPGPRRVDGGP
ncbi:MAG TPA: cytochrome b [Geminicoccaceae bacterium]|nr:cytochrome b [Geminicoccaceae bacterium]